MRANPTNRQPPNPPTGKDRSMKVSIKSIILDAGTQMRVAVDAAVIDEYAERMAEGDQFPPVDLITDGSSYWPWDGHCRIEASNRVGFTEIEANVESGTLLDAQMKACGSNAQHGMRRTNADKRNAATAALGFWP